MGKQKHSADFLIHEAEVHGSSLGGDFTSDAIEIADTMLPELDFLPILEKIRVFCINKEDKANLIYAEAVIKQIKEGLESE